MNSYKFETAQLGISEPGIHLLRSVYNYQTIPFESIDTIVIKTGRQIRKWLLSLIFGIVLVSTGFYFLYPPFV
ncbi:MAG: hypothetical protein JWQ40_3472 [Segetibacter sp.]|nr:hypothetical protein [Segetibacter sp.]